MGAPVMWKSAVFCLIKLSSNCLLVPHRIRGLTSVRSAAQTTWAGTEWARVSARSITYSALNVSGGENSATGFGRTGIHSLVRSNTNSHSVSLSQTNPTNQQNTSKRSNVLAFAYLIVQRSYWRKTHVIKWKNVKKIVLQFGKRVKEWPWIFETSNREQSFAFFCLMGTANHKKRI